MREIWFSFVVLATLAGLSPTAAAAPPPVPTTPAGVLAVSPDDRILGKTDAPITIIEYASLTCPHCRDFDTETLPQLKAKWIDTGKAKLVLRDYPLDEPAMRAAMIARCAPPERFYAFIDTFFRDQEQWAMARDYRAALERLALLGGISKQRFAACIADKAGEDRVVNSRLVATRTLGVNATPTFFINGTKLDGAPTLEAFDRVLSGLAAKS